MTDIAVNKYGFDYKRCKHFGKYELALAILRRYHMKKKWFFFIKFIRDTYDLPVDVTTKIVMMMYSV
jgi:hypothetical protein